MDANDVTILVDSRERRPLLFAGVNTERATLHTGDYSVRLGNVDYREIVAIERKSLSDLLGCVGAGRARFERELERLSRIACRALVIEASLPQCATEAHRFSTLSQQQVIGTLMSWWLKFNVPAIFASDRNHAACVVTTLLRLGSKYAWQRAQRSASEYNQGATN